MGTLTDETNGKIGSNSYDFSSGRLTIDTTNMVLHLDSTICFWVYTDALPISRWGVMETQYGAEWAINSDIAGNLQWYYGTSGSQASPYYVTVASGIFEVGKWVHVTLRRHIDSNTMTVYKNGILTHTHNMNAKPVKGTNNLLSIGYSYTDRKSVV